MKEDGIILKLNWDEAKDVPSVLVENLSVPSAE